MPEQLNPIIEKILSYEGKWCKNLKIYNPYNDPWPVKISRNMPDFDIQAFRKYRNHNFVYDKLYIAQSQGIRSGTLSEVVKSNNKNLEFPIFIKPRYGHKSASSKNCYKIKNFNELKNYENIPEMMWSEFINETEGMTDFFLYEGRIVHQITYEYSTTQHGVVADDWKKISSSNKPPNEITNWVNENMKNFTGPCNVQYRGTKIIEVGLRLARGGAYIYSTDNPVLIKSINQLVDDNSWDWSVTKEDLNFNPYYSFKCYTERPIIYLYPQHLLDKYMKDNNCKAFYEYYFEPGGSGLSMVCFQFLHEDFEKGMKIKKNLELLISFIQLFFIIAFLFAIWIFLFYHRNLGVIVLIILTIFFATRFINPLSTNLNLYNAQKQALFG